MMSHCHDSPGPHWWYSDLLFSCPSKSSYMILTPSWNSRQDIKFLIVFKYLRVHATAANTAQHSLPARINSLNIKPALTALSFHFKIYYVTLDVLVVLCNKILHLPKSRGWETQYRRFTENSSSHTLQVPLYTQPLLVWEPPSPLSHSTQSVFVMYNAARDSLQKQQNNDELQQM